MAKKNGSGNGAAAQPHAVASVPEGAGVSAPVPREAGSERTLKPEDHQKLAKARAQVREAFGQIVMAIMLLPRYRSQNLADLQHLVLEALIRDRVAIAYPGGPNADPQAEPAGFAIWASVSETTDAAIRQQIKAGIFPVRLKAEDWTSGPINWLLDVIAPDARSTARVIANFKQVVKQGDLHLHPLIARLVDEDALKKMGAKRLSAPKVRA